LIGDALRAPGAPLASRSFAARVSAALELPEGVAAEVEVAPAPVFSRRIRRPLAASALAASAAVAAVMLLRPATDPMIVDSTDHQYVPAVQVLAGTASPTPAQSQRLASYMVAHSQFSTPMVRRNVWSSLLAADPGITRVSYDAGEAN